MDGPKFNMAHNPVYQIDFSAVESGKRITASKRRVRFRFGYSNPESIDQGLSGTDCRGEEHEVTLVWSLTSGKRLVLADGHEVHFSKGSLQQTKFDTSWTMRGGHTVKIVAHAAPPLFNTPGFKQFELFIDGMSFFQMPKIYELGKGNSRSIVPRAVSPSAGYNNYSLPPQQEAYYQERVSAHEERRQLDHGGYSTTTREAATVAPEPSFAARPEPPRADSMPADLMSDPTPILDMQDHLDAPVPLLEQGGSATVAGSTFDEFAPVAPAPETPCMANIHSEILHAYGPPATKPALPALAAESHTQGVPMVTPTYHAEPQFFAAPTPANNLVSPVSDLSTPSNFYSPQQQPQYYQPHEQPQYQQAPPPPQYYQPEQPQYQQPPVQEPPQYQQPHSPEQPVKLTMTEYYQEEIKADPEKVEDALKSLVNLDDITQDPDTPEKQRLNKLEQQKQEALAKKKSKPVPPKHGAWHLGPAPSLNEVKETAQPSAPPQREIMRTHAFDPRAAQAGMMVVYGQAPMQQQQAYHHSSIGGMGFGQSYVASQAY